MVLSRGVVMVTRGVVMVTHGDVSCQGNTEYVEVLCDHVVFVGNTCCCHGSTWWCSMVIFVVVMIMVTRVVVMVTPNTWCCHGITCVTRVRLLRIKRDGYCVKLSFLGSSTRVH